MYNGQDFMGKRPTASTVLCLDVFPPYAVISLLYLVS